jgi:hypothetical protein
MHKRKGGGERRPLLNNFKKLVYKNAINTKLGGY